MSDKKQESNRRNARNSTGPKTAAGRKVVSQNAQRHGILSTHLILEGESRDEFDLLLATLQQEMQPVGLLEQTLVERIAVSIWRQRRLVRAESSEILLKQRIFVGQDMVTAASSFGLSSVDKRLRDTMNFPDMPRAEGGSAEMGHVLADLLALSAVRDKMMLEEMEKRFPLAYGELMMGAGCSHAALGERIAAKGGLGPYLADFIGAYRMMYDQERIKEFVALYRDSAQIRASVDLIGRYQSALDNELYKAMRALREAQAWRFSRLEANAKRVDDGVA